MKEGDRVEGMEGLIISLLGLSKKAASGPIIGSNVRPDLEIVDGDDRFIVEVTNTATMRDLMQLAFYQRLMAREPNIHFVLAAKVVPTSVLDAADRIGVEVLAVPHSVSIGGSLDLKGRITTEKAWRVASRLVRDRVCSIRSIALSEGLSYGWAHKIVKRMMAMGIVDQKGSVVELSDVNRLLDAVAWQRPFSDHRIGSIGTDLFSSYEAAETITRSLGQLNTGVFFTSYTAATLYIGYGIRHDSVQCYVPDKRIIRDLEGILPSGDRVRVEFFSPDRDMERLSREIEGVRVVSPAQTLLDLAGLGYSGRDISLEMVDHYGNIADNNG